jgi:hypothetical protein
LTTECRLPAPFGDRLLGDVQGFGDDLGCIASVGHQGDSRTKHLALGACLLADDGLQVVPLLLGERDRMSRASACHSSSMFARFD